MNPALRAYLYLAAFVPMTFIVSGCALLSTIFDGSGRNYAWFARVWARLSLGLAGVSVTLRGAEQLPPGPVILMSNHQSNFDILSLLSTLPRQIHWIAKKELFEIPIFGPSMRRGGYIPLDRGDGRKAMKSMDDAARMVREGRSVVMFPEGTRSPDGRLLPFKRGGFMLARKAGVPVVPVTINGSGRINPASRLLLHRGTIEIILHPPLPLPAAGSKAETEALLMEQVHSAIESRLEL